MGLSGFRSPPVGGVVSMRHSVIFSPVGFAHLNYPFHTQLVHHLPWPLWSFVFVGFPVRLNFGLVVPKLSRFEVRGKVSSCGVVCCSFEYVNFLPSVAFVLVRGLYVRGSFQHSAVAYSHRYVFPLSYFLFSSQTFFMFRLFCSSLDIS